MPVTPRPPRAMRLLPLIAGLAATGLAQADDPNPYYIGASQSVTHDSNVFLSQDGVPAVSDTLYTTSLVGGIDQPIGRERLFGNVALRHTRYGSNSDLNNNGYGATLGLDWATIERISGNFTYSGSRTLAQLNADGGPILLGKNIETSQRFDATANIGVVTRMTGVLTYGYRKLSYSSSLYDYRSFHQNAVSAGLRYSTSAALTFGAALRHTQGVYPNYPTGLDAPLTDVDDFKRNDLDLTAEWVPSGASRVNARLSYGKEDHTLATNRGFSGATGDLSWDWRPTGKLQFVTTLSRDTGQESAFYQRSQSSAILTSTGDISRVTNSLQLVAKYDLTAKVSLTATAHAGERTLVSTFTALQLSGHDRASGVTLAAKWVPTRNIEVGCNATRDRRSSDVLLLSLPYGDKTFGCYGQLVLQ